MRRAIIVFFPAVLISYCIASVLATQVILGELTAMGMPVTLDDRFRASFHDLRGLLASYLPLLLIAFALAFPVAALLGRWRPGWRFLLFPIAGAVAVVALHLIMKAVLGLNGIAAVRELPGLLSQMLAGWACGYLYYLFMGWARR
jgi:hypothetical protein